MAERSAIEWTDSTFNPWTGCTKVSPACEHCYAESWSKRAGEKVGKWGPGAPRVRTTPANWRKPVAWNAKPFFECAACGWRGDDMSMHPKGHSDIAVFPTRRRVFCASLADVFDNEVPPEWRADLFELIGKTPNLDWLLLTKRIGNAAAMVKAALARLQLGGYDLKPWPWPNVWLGATVVNQEEADRDIPKLLATPARVRFLSMEPLLGPVDLRKVERFAGCMGVKHDALHPVRIGHPGWDQPPIDWVIVGGESGPHARPMQLRWVRDLVRQCRAAAVPVLVKQLGREVLDDGISSPGEHWPADKVRRPIARRAEADPGFVVSLRNAKGGDWSEWPSDVRVREFPEVLQ